MLVLTDMQRAYLKKYEPLARTFRATKYLLA